MAKPRNKLNLTPKTHIELKTMQKIIITNVPRKVRDFQTIDHSIYAYMLTYMRLVEMNRRRVRRGDGNEVGRRRN